ncbi:hypothetical protein NP493_522g02025 [Ridgeia piscesae]|uniref:Uncharacterized protein n=1 Tax=Ridgeia piscesae TaxID=27915 RepID=A0AAD9KY45_RIDPI|nr:hypothetical protein NP493_522g02025 [Ridgeia piscesae]
MTNNELWRRMCLNISSLSSDVSRANLTTQTAASAATDGNALVYIVVVLGFYSIGIVVLMIRYLKNERQDLVEEKMLDDFFRTTPRTLNDDRGRLGGKLALNALNAVSIISQPSSSRKVTFV